MDIYQQLFLYIIFKPEVRIVRHSEYGFTGPQSKLITGNRLMITPANVNPLGNRRNGLIKF